MVRRVIGLAIAALVWTGTSHVEASPQDAAPRLVQSAPSGGGPGLGRGRRAG